MEGLSEVCVVPILLYGCENWQLTSTLVCQSFQGEIGSKLTPYHSTYSSRVALRWPSVAARILSRKLNYILRLKLMDSTESIASKLYNSFDPLHLSLIHECKFLEEHTGLESYTEKVLSGEFDGQRKTLSNEIMKQDWQITLEKGHERDSPRIATRIANEVSWLKLWDAMLDEGAHGTVRLQSLYKVITWPKVGNISVCPVCEWESNTHLFPHLLYN